MSGGDGCGQRVKYARRGGVGVAAVSGITGAGLARSRLSIHPEAFHPEWNYSVKPWAKS